MEDYASIYYTFDGKVTMSKFALGSTVNGIFHAIGVVGRDNFALRDLNGARFRGDDKIVDPGRYDLVKRIERVKEKTE